MYGCNHKRNDEKNSRYIEKEIKVKSVKSKAGNATNYYLNLNHNNFHVTETDGDSGYTFSDKFLYLDINKKNGNPSLIWFKVNNTINWDLNADGIFDARVFLKPLRSYIWFSNKWVKVYNSKAGFKFYDSYNEKNKFKFTNGSWIMQK